MQIYSFSPFGYEGSLVNVEVDLRRGIPAIDIVGLADGAVKESRERMRTAIKNSGFEFPPERVLISLSPADVKKEGALFDLAIALAVLAAKEGLTESEADKSILVIGELELNGRVRPVRGVHAAVSTAKAGGIKRCIVPSINADEAREVPGMSVFGAEDLTEAFKALKTPSAFTAKHKTIGDMYKDEAASYAECIDGIYFAPVNPDLDFADVEGQGFLIRALQIAAAGGHNILAFGPPGCGKTLSLQRFPSLLPLLTPEEAQPVTRIYSIAGLLQPHQGMIRVPPFRQPHQTASIEGICGGGPHCTPGEISLAHNGVLFLDEAAEFRSSVLQMLRVPLESGQVTLSRAGRSTVYPARFQFLAAMNPCPCGFYGSSEKICLCSAHAVEQYWKKLSGPLLDRIDIRVHSRKEKQSDEEKVSSQSLRPLIARAIVNQRKRQKKLNAYLSTREVSKICTCTDKAIDFFDKAKEKYKFSPRAISSCLKVAKTIADMYDKVVIDYESIKEAVGYRKTEGGLVLGGGM